jgi:hypothetical protein
MYVFDRLVLPTLSREDILAAGASKLSLDAATRQYIHYHLSYRFVITDDGQRALVLERTLQRGAIRGERPLLNPR